jgi:hypothetical protein
VADKSITSDLLAAMREIRQGSAALTFAEKRTLDQAADEIERLRAALQTGASPGGRMTDKTPRTKTSWRDLGECSCLECFCDVCATFLPGAILMFAFIAAIGALR